MNAKFNHFYSQKSGNDIKDYEDAYSPKIDGSINTSYFCCAIADGAAESSFASDWAKMLTRSFVKEPYKDLETLKIKSDTLGQRWRKVVQRRPLPWFAEEKVQFGAFATLLGLEISSSLNSHHSSGEWSAIAIGDSCLFQIRNSEIITAFPVATSDEFNNSPILLSSNSVKNISVWDKVLLKKGNWETGDTIFLMTDAIANWFLSQHEQNEHPWENIIGFTENDGTKYSFEYWINSLRSNSQIKNDDVTILSIKF
jgi:hypothetical protein